MQIRVGTLNVWGLPEPLSPNLAARIDAIGAKLPSLDLDVIAFQEVWTLEARRTLERAGHRAGLSHCWHGGEDALGAGGLLVLSRLPIEAVEFETFALRGDPERVANGEYVSGKGFAMIRLTTAAGPLVLIDTHFHARYTSSAPHRYIAHRTGQAIQLAARFWQTSEPIVAVGDFNFREGEPDYRVLTDILGLRDTAAVLDRREPTTLGSNPYRNSNRIDRRKDFVFVRDGSERGVKPNTITRVFDEIIELDGRPAAYSNHAGLVVELELGEPQSPLAVQDRSIFDLAAEVLAQGESAALRHRQVDRTLAGVGIGAAAVAGLSTRRFDRRSLLRMSLGGAALLALTPGLGFSLASEVLIPQEIRAFQKAAEQLARLHPDRNINVLAAS